MSTTTGGEEVTLKLTVDADQGKKNLKSLAEETRNVGKEARATQKDFDAMGEAARRLQHNARERQVQAAMGQLDPSSVKPPALPFHARHEAMQIAERQRQGRQVERERQKLEYANWQNTPWTRRSALPPGAMGRMAAGAAPFAAIGGAAHVLASASVSSVRDIGGLTAERVATGANGSVSANEASQMFARGLADSIPVLGSFRKQIEDLGTASQKAAANIALAGLQATGRIQDAAVYGIGQRGEAGRTIHALDTAGFDARAEATARRNYANSLTPDRVAQFTGAYGAEKEAAAEAHVNVETLRRQLADRHNVLAGANAEYRDAFGRARAAGASADEAMKAAREATRAKQEHLKGFGSNTTHQTTGRRLEQAEKDALAAGQAEVGDSRMEGANAQEKAKNAQQQLNDAQQTAIALAKAELDERRQILAIDQKMVAQNASAATRFGGGTRAQVAEYGQLARQFQQSGLDGMTPDQIAQLRQGPLGELVEEAQKKRGDKWSRDEGIGDIKSELTGRDINSKPLAEQELQTRKEQKDAEAGAAEQKADIAQNFAGKMAEAVADVMELAIDAFRRELEAKVQHEILQKKGS